MSLKVEIVFNEPALEALRNISNQMHRDRVVHDMLVGHAAGLVSKVSNSGLESGTTITANIGMTYDGECTEVETQD